MARQQIEQVAQYADQPRTLSPLTGQIITCANGNVIEWFGTNVIVRVANKPPEHSNKQSEAWAKTAVDVMTAAWGVRTTDAAMEGMAN